MLPLTPDERRTFALSVLTAAATSAVAASVNWLFSEAQRVVQARRDESAKRAAAGADREVAS